jgi:uncharacterized protein YoxC
MIDTVANAPKVVSGERSSIIGQSQFRLIIGEKNLQDDVSRDVERLFLDPGMYQAIEEWPNGNIVRLIDIRERARELAGISTNRVSEKLECIAHTIGLELQMEVSLREKRRRKKAREKVNPKQGESIPTRLSPVACASDPETPDRSPAETVIALS